MRIAIFLGCIILFINPSHSQEFNTARLDSLLQILDENDRFMGSISVSKGDQLLYSNAVGFADIKDQKKATTETKYRIGSITKMFTSVLIFKAIEDKKLDLETTLDGFFPEIEKADEITISDLLSHRSGIYNFTNSPTYPGWSTQKKSREDMVKIIAQSSSIFDPGSKAEYSNSNFVLLTFILEDVFKTSYKNLVEELFPITWHPVRAWDWCFDEDQKETVAILFENTKTCT